jgi:hypothetical protein
VTSLGTSSQVQAGGRASFVIWVWTTKAAATGVSVTASVAAAPSVGTPTFTVCPAVSGAICKVGSLPIGQADELEATVPVQSSATLGELVQLNALASASGASGYIGTATDVVVLSPTSSPTSPLVTLPVPSTLPPIAGTSVSAINPAALFPTVGASTGPGPLSPSAVASGSFLHADAAASAVPLDGQIGIQLAGLVILVGAVSVAIVRVSLRKPKESAGAAASKASDPKA